MGFDDRARNVKSHAGSGGLRRNEWLEDAAHVLTLNPYARAGLRLTGPMRRIKCRRQIEKVMVQARSRRRTARLI